MDALQEIAREIGAFLWRKRLNLSKQLMLAGPSKYHVLMIGKVAIDPPLDNHLFVFSRDVISVDIPLKFVESASLSLCHVSSSEVAKKVRLGKYTEKLLPYSPPEKDHFVVLPCATCIENFVVCMWDMGSRRIRYTSLQRFKELTVEDYDPRVPNSY